MRDRSKTTGQRVIFLDRDGTINVDHGYVGRLEDWQFQPGAWRLAITAGFEEVAPARSQAQTSGVLRSRPTAGLMER